VGLINTFAFGASMLAGLISGKLVDKFSEKSVIIAIVLLMGSGLLLFTRIELDTSLWVLALTVSILGLSQGMKGPAIMKIALRQVPADKMSAGSGLFSMMRDFGTPAGVAIGLALYSSSLARNTQEQILVQAQAMGLDPALLPALADAFVSKGATMPAELQQGLAAINADYTVLAETAGYNGIATAIPEVGMILFPVLGLALLLTLLLPRNGGDSAASKAPAGH
jgi:MFS family permease